MIFVLDANILILAALNIEGPYSKLILNKASFIEFVFMEITKNEQKICNYNKDKLNSFRKNVLMFKPQFAVVNDEEISDNDLSTAFNYTKNIDPKDTIYIALAIALDALLLTDDKKLLYALRKKGFRNIISVPEFKNILKVLNND